MIETQENITVTTKDLNLILDGLYSESYELISHYISLLVKKNNELNLISRTITKESLLIDHLYDCISAFYLFKPYNKITDIGAGGGFPGILLACIFPDKEILLVEKSPKKCSFLNEIITELKLSNARVENKLVETIMYKPDMRESNIILTCRAFKPIPVILSLLKNTTNYPTKLVLFKGKLSTIDEEITLAKKNRFKFIHQIIKVAPKNAVKERNIVIVDIVK